MKTTVEIVMNSRMDSGITNNELTYRLLMNVPWDLGHPVCKILSSNESQFSLENDCLKFDHE